eukprot:3703814-Pleurochrysis_carterae.AAC.3
MPLLKRRRCAQKRASLLIKMKFQVNRAATAKWTKFGSESRAGSSDAVQLGYNSSSRCLKRRA